MALRTRHTEMLQPSSVLVEAFGQIYDLDNGAVRLTTIDGQSISLSFAEIARLDGICFPEKEHTDIDEQNGEPLIT